MGNEDDKEAYDVGDVTPIRRLEIDMIGKDGGPLPDLKYKVEFLNGTTRSGATDDQGRIVEKDVPEGQFYLTIEREAQ